MDDCDSVREALSAWMDGEQALLAAPAVTAHLDRCRSCRAWREAGHEVTRRFRLTRTEPGCDLSPAIVAMWRSQRPRRRQPEWARVGLLAVAAGQLAFTVPCLVLGQDHTAPLHVAHEEGSFDLALAAGFAVAAWRPSRARGMIALVGIAALTLLATATADLLFARTDFVDEAPHLLILGGWFLLRHLVSESPGADSTARHDWRRRGRTVFSALRTSRTAWSDAADAGPYADAHITAARTGRAA